MPKGPKVSNSELIQTGLEGMSRNGKQLSKIPSKTRAMLYELPSGETVRVRTCNDHVLIVIAETPSQNAKLNIDGTDWILVVMPEIERTPGATVTYLIPTSLAIKQAKKLYEEWMASNPDSNGNTTWNLPFRPENPEDFWDSFRLPLSGSGPSSSATTNTGITDVHNMLLIDEIELARQRIAQASGVDKEAVTISIDFMANLR